MKIKNPENNTKNKNKKNNENKKEKIHGKCHERDCLAKQEILKPLLRYDMKAKDLFENCEYKGEYSDFRSHLSRYVKRGYVEKYGPRPSYYQITDLGREVCIDHPFAYREERIRLHKEIVKNFDKRMKMKYGEVVHVQSGDTPGGGTGGGYSGGSISNTKEFGGSGDEYISGKKLEEKDKKIKEMEEKIKDQKETEEYLSRKNNELETELKSYRNKQMNEHLNKRAKREQEIAEQKRKADLQRPQGRLFDETIWAFKDRKISESAYKKLPTHVVQVITTPPKSVTESVKDILRGKKKGQYVAVPAHTVSTLTKLGFVRVLTKNEIESLTLKIKNGYVFLDKFKITEAPKVSQTNKPPQVRIKTGNS